MLAGGSLVAFALSRTVGLFGFSEQGWQPSPHAALDVVAELLTLGLFAVYLVEGWRARGSAPAAPQEAAPPRQGLSFR
jgi:hypothetical protein